MSFPKMLNIGSGKDFKENFLNLDADAFWKPDIIYDLNIPLPRNGAQKFHTSRFGEIEVRSNMFEKIIAYDVLEHITKVHICMKSCLDLLKVTGILEIYVPYDLSLGAWQDPTHVRTFNENSWLYYTDWFWYLGWTEARFVTETFSFKLSPFGHELQVQGKGLQELIRTPRAVDAMFVQLRKVPLSNHDIKQLKHFRGKPRS